MSEELYERAAKILGWSHAEATGFSLATLRELVREKDAKLAADIAAAIASGAHLRGQKPVGPLKSRWARR